MQKLPKAVDTWTIANVIGSNEPELERMIQYQELQELVIKSFTPVGWGLGLKQFIERLDDDDDETDPLRRMLFFQGIPSQGKEKEPTNVKDETFAGVRLKVPKLPSFSGDKKSKDVTFARWQYEIKVVLQGPYDSCVIQNAVHQTLKSPAADLLVNMGPEVSVEQILNKFRKMY